MREEEMEELAREIADVLGIEAERIRVVLVTPTEVEVTIVGETLTAAEARASQLVELIRSGGTGSGSTMQLLRKATDAHMRKDDQPASSEDDVDCGTQTMVWWDAVAAMVVGSGCSIAA